MPDGTTPSLVNSCSGSNWAVMLGVQEPMIYSIRLLLVSVAATLSACSGGGDDSASAACTLLTGGGTTVAFTPSPSCVNCTAQNLSAAIDGSLSSGATITVPSGVSGTAGVTATAQNGIIFPSGSVAGSVVSFPTGQGNMFGLITYLDGVRQEVLLTSSSGTSPIYVSGDTTLPFDAIEITLNRTTPAVDAQVDVLGFCSQVNRSAAGN
jgi:hypothetical protein